MTRTFKGVKKAFLKKLEMYVPVVDRVHGDKHNEFHEVKRLFDIIDEKLRSADSEIPDLKQEFNSLREVTSNYTVPMDVCETYETVYMMLKELDEAYTIIGEK